jgi:uncharacterized protein YecE (DUF72 family)
VGRIRVGLSGWSYDGWKGDFYPAGLAHGDRLGFVADRFDTVEVNGTFYSLTSPGAVRGWYESVPASFTLALKGSRFITHARKLKVVESALANFFAAGVLELGEKMGPILWQLPGHLHFDAERIDDFLGLLPADTDAARALARRHDDRVDDVAFGPAANHRLRHVLEVRHESYLVDGLVTIARRHGTALAFSHARHWPYLEEVTAGFVYLRLHGPGEAYASAYGEETLGGWAERIRRWRDGDQPDDAATITDRTPPRRKSRDVYVYFDNDQGGHAPRDAALLRDLLDPT